jgi:hypothetical protein
LGKKKTKKKSPCIDFWYGYESARLVLDFGSSPFGCPSGGRFLPLLIRLISICSCRWRLLLGFPCLVLDLRQDGFAVHSGSAVRCGAESSSVPLLGGFDLFRASFIGSGSSIHLCDFLKKFFSGLDRG